MPIKFVNDEIPAIERVITGFPSFDLALSDGKGNIGYPLRTLTEIFGASGIGKSTVMFSLAAIIANQLGGKIDFADFEGQSRDTLANAMELQGFDGDIDVLRGGKVNTHEKMMDKMIADMTSGKDCSVSMLDSVGGFTPIGEIEGSVADANMGQKARIVGNWSRGMINALLTRKTPATGLYISHQHSNIGYLGKHTSGGETKAFLNGVQLEFRMIGKTTDYEGGWVLDGRVKKNRYGKPDRNFYMFVIGGVGAHTGLSAVFDCYYRKLATIERKVVYLGDKSYGKIPQMIANASDKDLFRPFFDALKGAAPVEEASEEEDSDA